MPDYDNIPILRPSHALAIQHYQVDMSCELSRKFPSSLEMDATEALQVLEQEDDDYELDIVGDDDRFDIVFNAGQFEIADSVQGEAPQVTDTDFQQSSDSESTDSESTDSESTDSESTDSKSTDSEIDSEENSDSGSTDSEIDSDSEIEDGDYPKPQTDSDSTDSEIEVGEYPEPQTDGLFDTTVSNLPAGPSRTAVEELVSPMIDAASFPHFATTISNAAQITIATCGVENRSIIDNRPIIENTSIIGNLEDEAAIMESRLIFDNSAMEQTAYVVLHGGHVEYPPQVDGREGFPDLSELPDIADIFRRLGY